MWRTPWNHLPAWGCLLLLQTSFYMLGGQKGTISAKATDAGFLLHTSEHDFQQAIARHDDPLCR